MRRSLRRSFVSTSLVTVAMILGQGASQTLAQVPQPPTGTYYYYPAPGAVSSSSMYYVEPAPPSANPSPGYYYYPAQVNANRPAGYYYYPGEGYVRPPVGVYYYYPAARRAPASTVPATPVRRGLFGFPRPNNVTPQPGDNDDYEYKT